MVRGGRKTVPYPSSIESKFVIQASAFAPVFLCLSERHLKGSKSVLVWTEFE